MALHIFTRNTFTAVAGHVHCPVQLNVALYECAWYLADQNRFHYIFTEYFSIQSRIIQFLCHILFSNLSFACHFSFVYTRHNVQIVMFINYVRQINSFRIRRLYVLCIGCIAFAQYQACRSDTNAHKLNKQKTMPMVMFTAKE